MSDKVRMDILEKISTGIEGFDDITEGGLPRRRTTLVMGGPGCGKTVFALQILVSSAVHHGMPGIFVAFEENARRVSANAETFGWNMRELEKKQIFFIDASMRSDVVKSGAFDLTGLLAALEAKAREMGAELIVFDAIDVLLSLLDDPAAECRELYRLHEWLMLHGLTGIVTTKVEDNWPATAQRYGFMPFMADCAVLLSQRVTDRVAVRAMRVIKYRGSSHALNEVPFAIGPVGLEVGSSNGVHPEPQPFHERISTGIERLDTMLCGGLYRGTNALITGSSGTGKSMLAGNFIAAACRRNERTLFISFDENARDIARDLATMSIDLAPHLESGLLRMEALRSEAASSEEHFMRIKRLIVEQKPRCVAIDPISALARVGGGMAARAVAERLIYLCRNAGITVLFTSLLEGVDPHLETTPLHISTISDSWMQITYTLLDGERNRALSIIKSRGSKHSNQQRELIFSESGLTLADPYTGGGKVLVGTLRLEREIALHLAAHPEHQERRELKPAAAQGKDGGSSK
jgi:circadian clock protein KaiC